MKKPPIEVNEEDLRNLIAAIILQFTVPVDEFEKIWKLAEDKEPPEAHVAEVIERWYQANPPG